MIWWITLIIFVLILLYKSIRFVQRGGRYTQPAYNSSLLYYQIKNVYAKMTEHEQRFLALYINSAGARNEFSEASLSNIVQLGDSWEGVCELYNSLWAERVAHIDESRVDPWQRLKFHLKVEEEIKRAETEILNGSRKCEWRLRSIPQSMLIALLGRHPELSGN